MAQRLYPDDRQSNPDQLTFEQYILEARALYSDMVGAVDEDEDHELKFLKFVLAGRRGLDIEDQEHVSLNTLQGLPPLGRINVTRDYDSLMGITFDLPYKVALGIWPVPPFKETLSQNSHITAPAFNPAGQRVFVPMHTIPNVPFGKATSRHVVRLFFPHMHARQATNIIPSTDLMSIYDHALRPIMLRLMPNHAGHWPVTYDAAIALYRDHHGHIRPGSLDVPSHLLPALAREFLDRVSTLRPYFRDAYFGHELRGWKGATVHDPTDEDDRQEGLADLTNILNMDLVNRQFWNVDVALEFGVPHHVVTWRADAHERVVRWILPNIQNLGRVVNSKLFYRDNAMHLQDIAGFRWAPSQRQGHDVRYIQAYTTEKAVSYQHHRGLFSPHSPEELLYKPRHQKLLQALDKQSEILQACAGGPANEQQDGCARLEIRVPLSRAEEVLLEPLQIAEATVVKIPSREWWYFKWYRLAAVYRVLDNMIKAPGNDRAWDSSLALGALVIWILNGAHRTPWGNFRALAQEAAPHLLDDPEFDAGDDPDAPTHPLMYEGGVYFLCDIERDQASHSFRIAYGKQFTADAITRVYKMGSLAEIRLHLGVAQVERGRRKIHASRTQNRTAHTTTSVDILRDADRELPTIGDRLDQMMIMQRGRMQGRDVEYFHQQGGGNRQPIDDAPNGEHVLATEVRKILEQFYYDMLAESPNHRCAQEGAWTNIPPALREGLAVEDLYAQLRFPFSHCQYILCTPEQWAQQFDRFFPSEVVIRPGQNFKKARYYKRYTVLIGNLSIQDKRRLQQTLKNKFDTLAWVPRAASDRMWNTKKETGGQWQHLPSDEERQGPQIAVNPNVKQRRLWPPMLRDAPPLEEGEVVDGDGDGDGEAVNEDGEPGVDEAE